jgi:hypothetical protein
MAIHGVKFVILAGNHRYLDNGNQGKQGEVHQITDLTVCAGMPGISVVAAATCVLPGDHGWFRTHQQDPIYI